MTPEQFIAYKEANHQRVLDFVRTATGPVFVSDVVESMSPNMQEHKDGLMRSLVWDMIGPKWLHDGGHDLVINNDLSISLREDDQP